MTGPLATSYREALRAMELRGPRALHATATALGDLPFGVTADDESLRAYIVAADADDALRKELAVRLATWDAADSAEWTDGTVPRTAPRRARIMDLLGVDDKTAALFDDRFLIAGGGIIVDGPWEPWYTKEIRDSREFYWRHYSDYLLNKPGFDGDAIATLNASTTDVVERLADPTWTEKRHQAKGLVVGYVQSGKTAHFTGVIAKAIDAGYRLIIVLTGTTDLLRTQTQRRLDMELVGRENLLRGISEDDTESFDYHDDPDWLDGKFLRHGCRPTEAGQPDIIRLTTRDFDYQSLRQGISALDFKRADLARPFNDPINLMPSDARLIVIKKNGQVLQKLVKDLGKITARLTDIPAIVIDDESDQASPNTSNPSKWQEDQKVRTTINSRIGDLLSLLPRAQYIGYTATPFANVFIDPSDAEDIFPKDFLISLDPPLGYMGARDFHDFDESSDSDPSGGRTYATSKEAAHVRPIPDADADDVPRLLEAMDAFVLTGAVKLYRHDHGVDAFEHHTMLVHEAMKRAVHREEAAILRELWLNAGYYAPASGDRLRRLYEADLLPVSRALGPNPMMPASYDELTPYVARAVRAIGQTGDPVIVVNSEADMKNEEVDFDKRSVWRILVGGNKLARGFTVEGLTVSYYRRVTKQQDTLMQMGRWFGFRRGYRDLVRLYITPALHEAFEASCRDEESFRDELRRYATPVNGQRQIVPAEIPPLVAQHLSWLKPTAANKMYNAVLAERRSPGIPIEPRCYPSDPARVRPNTEAFRPLVDATNTEVRLYDRSEGWDYRAFVGSVSHPTLLSVLQSIKLAVDDYLVPDLRWLTALTPDQINQWIVIFPQQVREQTRRRIFGHQPMSVFTRQRLRADYYSAISEERHRRPIDRITRGESTIGDPAANSLVGPRSGAVLVYPTVDRRADRSGADVPGQQGDDLRADQVTLAFHLVAPLTAIGDDQRLVTFTTRDRSRADQAIIDMPARRGGL
jgi:hypothetical protein